MHTIGSVRLNIYSDKTQIGKTNKVLAELSLPDRYAINKFLEHCLAEGLSMRRVIKYMYLLKKLALFSDKPLAKNEKEGIIRLLSIIACSNYAEWTKRDYKITIKKFYRWLGKGKLVNWIKTTMKKNHSKLPEELLTEDEILKMIECADHTRNKALISVLYEGGLRIAELLSLQIRDVQFDEFGAVIIVTGKTGARRVRLVSSVPYLSQWLNLHPHKHNPSVWLWCRLGSWKYRKDPLTYAGAKKLLKDTAIKAGIKKRIYPHLFRHSRATYLAKYLTESQLCNYLGWVNGSDMAATYVHLSGRDQDDAILKVYGLKKGDIEESKMKPINCFKCRSINPVRAIYCNKCGFPLNDREKQDYYQQETSFPRKEAIALFRKIIREELEIGRL